MDRMPFAEFGLKLTDYGLKPTEFGLALKKKEE